MRDIYISYGRLLTTYQLLDVKDKTVDQAMRAITGSWTTYATHYAVGQRVGGPPFKGRFSSGQADLWRRRRPPRLGA